MVHVAVFAVLALVIGVLLVTLLLPSAPSSATEGVVQRVVDGDTLVITTEGKEEDVRVLNIDTPETKHPGKPVECLGREASAFTEAWAPPGTVVTLSFDEERRDRYGRLLAWVERSDGTSLSEALAEAGLGVPAEYGDNVAFHPRVTAARDLAIEGQRGFFDKSLGCTAPAQVAKARAQLQAANQTPRGDSVESLVAPVAALTAAVATADRLLARVESVRRTFAWSALPSRIRGRLTQRLSSASSQAKQRLERLQLSRKRMIKRARAAERRRQAELARERAAREAAAAQVEADADANLTAPAPADNDDDDDAYVPPAPDPLDGYTGPRCYEPGGQVWHPC